MSEFRARQASAANILGAGAKPGADVLMLVSRDSVGWEDIYYYTGFAGTSAVYVQSRSDTLLFVDPRYEETAASLDTCSVVSCTEVHKRSPLEAALDHLRARRVSRIAFGGATFPHSLIKLASQSLGDEVEAADATPFLVASRRRKSVEEVACIRHASVIASRAYSDTVAEAREGMTEREFASLLSYRITSYGGDFFGSFPVVTASGERSAMPHAQPTDRKFRLGDAVVVDFSARWCGYLCDITRMFSIGPMSAERASLFSLLTWAQSEAAARLRAGASASEVDAAARGVIEQAGLGHAFTHGTGHGIGLCIHELPSISRSASGVLAQGDVVTIEPGIYIKGEFGMRIEDDYLITNDGAVCITENLSREIKIV